jgi:hypothetical protein
MNHLDRRAMLRLLFGAGALGLRSLATGIPISLLADPRRALAADPPSGRPAQFVLLATSADGDPIGCNVPGTYLDQRIVHPPAPTMQATPLVLSGQTFTAAKPWAELPQQLLDRTCFFHHATHSLVHAEEQKVMSLNFGTTNREMMICRLAAQLAPKLGTVQSDPIVLGPRQSSEDLVYENRPQPIIPPSMLARFIGAPGGPLGKLTELRDRDLDRMNAFLRSEGNKAQAAYIDQYVHSQRQLRAISEDLLGALQAIKDDSADSQVRAAVTLFRMKVAPVVSVHIPFGGDNHQDADFRHETAETLTGVATIGHLWEELVRTGMQDRVSFLSFNVFGRPLSPPMRNGRDHSANHHAAIMFGSAFRGSVVGGVTPMDNDFGATSIDSKTGAGLPKEQGDIRFSETLHAMATTFSTGAGVDPLCLGPTVQARVVKAALKNA